MTTSPAIKDSAVRVARTFAQSLIATVGLNGAGVIHANWTESLSVAGSAALMAILTALAGVKAPATDSTTPTNL